MIKNEMFEIANNRYLKWIKNINDTKVLKALKSLSKEEIIDRFYFELKFGTAGVRDLMGVGANRINKYNVRKITHAYAKFLIKNFDKKELSKGIVIIHDNRHNSASFAMHVATVLTYFKINVYLAKNNGFTPTPYGCFLVQYKNTLGGVVITASHNSKKYNGYKLFDKNGAQAMPIETNKIIEHFNTIDYDFSEKMVINKDLVHYLTDKDFEAYLIESKKILINKNDKKILKCIFSPMFGVTQISIGPTLESLGYDYEVVEKENHSDPNFGNKKYLNPELKSVYKEALELAKSVKPDVIFQSDPDGDRMGVCVFDKENNDYELISTNRIAQFLLFYILFETNKEINNKYIYSNIISSTLISKIAKDHNIHYDRFPVGPKWMTDAIIRNHNEKNMVFSYEESCGFIISDKIRDKDSLQSICIIAEALNHYKLKNMDFYDIETAIAKKYGYLRDTRLNIEFIGGKEISNFSMKAVIDKIESFKIHDKLFSRTITKIIDSSKNKDSYYKTSCLRFCFNDDDNWIAMRRSGTEPKLKFYINCVNSNKDEAIKNLNDLIFQITSYINSFGFECIIK